MSTLVQNGIPIFSDIDGDPIEDGYIYIGEPGLNPESNPLQAYWDASLTIPAGNNPTARTKGGAAAYNGAPSRLYVPTNYSIVVKDKKNKIVYSVLDATDYTTPTVYVDSVADLATLTGTKEGQVIRVKGFYSGTPLEMPDYYSRPDSVETPNGFSIIANPDGGTFEWPDITKVNAAWLGVKNDGSTNISTIINTAIPLFDTIEFDEGGYLLEAQINLNYITIRGAGRYATYFLVDWGSGGLDTANSAVTLDYSAEIHDIGFLYPNQDNTGNPVLYPPSIYVTGYYGKIRNVALLNSYYGIYVDGSATEIEDVVGYPLWKGLYVFRAVDIPKISKCHWNPNAMWPYSNDVGSGGLGSPYGYGRFTDATTAWVGDNGFAYQFGRCDFTHINTLFEYGYWYGYYFKTDTSGSANAVTMLNCHSDFTAFPVFAQNWEEDITMQNCKLVGRGNPPTGYNQSVDGRCAIIGGGAVGEKSHSFNFLNCYMNNFNQRAVTNDDDCHLVFRDTTIKDFNIQDSGFSAIEDTASLSLTFDGGVIDFQGITNSGSRAILQSHAGIVNADKMSIANKSNGANIINAALSVVNAINLDVTGSGFNQIKDIDGNYIYSGTSYGTAVPTLGTFVSGHVRQNSAPAVGEYTGWKCTTGGTPGTWVGFGQLGMISNTTGQRPSSGIYDGYLYRDTTLNKIIMYLGGSWYEAADTSVAV